VILIDRAIRHAFGLQADPKRLRQLQVVASIGVQLVGALVVLLIIFGPPNQTPTIIGLATAGLTVALKDFIVAFFGWFALMGRNGIRVGDWVEINGVGGEVIEIGILKTVLLEMGSWTSTGHPTGRRVSFVNSYAIEGHYFNFSTAGQWLWDELQLTLPPTGDPYKTAEQIRQTVERETETDASAAEQEWERVTRQYGTRPFTAKPAVDLRPSVNGLNVIVRYITHAPQRYEVKTRLFAAIVDLLHKPAGTPLTPL
jgi:small-conductance mechanosensitive channel